MSEFILVVDTASPPGGVALLRSGTLVLSQTFPDSRSQAELLFPFLSTMLAEAGLELAQLAAIAVAAGPGSFTALRVGITAAKALGEVSGVPLVSVSNAEASALAGCEGLERVESGVVLLPASRSEVFLAPFALHGGASGSAEAGPIAQADAVSLTAGIEVNRLSAWKPPPVGGALDGAVDGAVDSAKARFSLLVSPSAELLGAARECEWATGARAVQIATGLLPSLGAIAWHRVQRRDFVPPLALDAAYVRRADADNSWVDPRFS